MWQVLDSGLCAYALFFLFSWLQVESLWIYCPCECFCVLPIWKGSESPLKFNSTEKLLGVNLSILVARALIILTQLCHFEEITSSYLKHSVQLCIGCQEISCKLNNTKKVMRDYTPGLIEWLLVVMMSGNWTPMLDVLFPQNVLSTQPWSLKWAADSLVTLIPSVSIKSRLTI